MVFSLEYVNNFLLYFVQTFCCVGLIEVIKNTTSQARGLAQRYNLLGHRLCNVGIIVCIKNFRYPLTLILVEPLYIACDE